MIDMYIREWATILEMLGAAFSLPVIAAVIVGTGLGIVAGVIPGLTATMAMALCLGFVFPLPWEVGWALLLSIYTGAIYAGGITAIMINIPGTPASVATCLDGFPLALKGKAREAIGIVTVSSGLGEAGGMLILYTLLPFAAAIALKLGSWELALICFIGVILAATLSGQSPLKGLIAGCLGLLIAMVGIEAIFAYPRFAYHPVLRRGFTLVPVLVGLFGISEVLMVLKSKVSYKLMGKPARAIVNWRDFKSNIVNIIRSMLIGAGIGIVPGIGESVAPWVAYGFAQSASKKKHEFGKGNIEGIIAPEVANNMVKGGALIPTMILGIPGSGPAAILLAALFIYGFRPGPLLIVESPGMLTFTIIVTLFSALTMIVAGLLLSKYIISILYLPRELLLPVIVVFCVIGAWAAHFTLLDVSIMFFFGLLGYLLRSRGFPLAPLILGVLIGPLLDEYLRRALLIHQHDLWAMITGPISLGIIAFLVFMIYSSYKMIRKAPVVEKTGEGEVRADTLVET